jgi:hypothetical protein
VKYMLLMQGAQSGWQEFMATMSPEDIRAHIAFMQKLNQELTAEGVLVDAQGLAGPDQAKIVRAQDGGPPAVTDGPFPETKEFLAGYWIVDCETLDQAIQIAARASAAPGAGGAPVNIPIEVREIGAPPQVDM